MCTYVLQTNVKLQDLCVISEVVSLKMAVQTEPYRAKNMQL